MGPGFWQMLIVLVIVLLLFGTKKLRNIGSDLGSAIKSFRSSMKDGGGEEEETKTGEAEQLEKDDEKGRVIEGEVTRKERDSA